MTYRNNWFGLNRYDPAIAETYSHGAHGTNSEDWDQAARRTLSAGLRHRQITISLTSQFTDSLLRPRKGSHAHMLATFVAAITTVHELRHTVFLHDLK